MDLTFNKIGNSYVAEFTAEADFNLHIPAAVGSILVNIRIVEKRRA